MPAERPARSPRRVARFALLAGLLGLAGTAVAADGEAVFNANCTACHQAGGVGAPGLAPPLVSQHVSAAAAKNPDYAALVVLNGLSGDIPLDGGDTISGIMPPLGMFLTDDEVAAVLDYVFKTLNGKDAQIDPKAIADLRSQKHSAKELRTMREELVK